MDRGKYKENLHKQKKTKKNKKKQKKTKKQKQKQKMKSVLTVKSNLAMAR